MPALKRLHTWYLAKMPTPGSNQIQRNWKYTGREGRGAEPRCVSCRDHVSATVHCATRMIGAGWQTPVIVMAVEALMICCCEASMTLMVVVNSDGRDDGGGGDECVCFLMTRFAQAHHGAASEDTGSEDTGSEDTARRAGGGGEGRYSAPRVRRHSAAWAGDGRETCPESPKARRKGHARPEKKKRDARRHHQPLAYRQPRGAQTARRVAEAILCQARLVLISSKMR